MQDQHAPAYPAGKWGEAILDYLQETGNQELAWPDGPGNAVPSQVVHVAVDMIRPGIVLATQSGRYLGEATGDDLDPLGMGID